MSISQFREWRAYGDLEPFDEEREDLRNAHVVAAVLNGAKLVASRGSRRIPQWTKDDDVLLRFGPQPEQKLTVEQRRQQIKNALSVMMAMQKKKPAKKKGKG